MGKRLSPFHQPILLKQPLIHRAVALRQSPLAIAPPLTEFAFETAAVSRDQHAFAMGQVVAEFTFVDRRIRVGQRSPALELAVGKVALVDAAICKW